MRKSIIIFFLLIILTLFYSTYYTKIHNTSNLPETTMVSLFSLSKAKVVSSELYFWGKIYADESDLDELKQLANVISEEIGIVKNSDFSLKTEKSDLSLRIDINGSLPCETSENKRIANVCIQSEDKAGKSSQVTISVRIIEDALNSGREELRKKITNVFEMHGIKPNVNSCIIGNYNGKLSDDQMNEICSRIFKGIEAHKVEGMRDGDLISISAYSPEIGNSIRVSEKKINLNIAIRYNSYEGKTYIWIATPVITIEY